MTPDEKRQLAARLERARCEHCGSIGQVLSVRLQLHRVIVIDNDAGALAKELPYAVCGACGHAELCVVHRE